jgi:hypothetical protein
MALNEYPPGARFPGVIGRTTDESSPAARPPQTAVLAYPSNYVEASSMLSDRAPAERLGLLGRVAAVRELRSCVLENGTHRTGKPSGASMRSGHAVPVEGRSDGSQRPLFCTFGLYALANALQQRRGPPEPDTFASLDSQSFSRAPTDQPPAAITSGRATS